MAPLLEQLLLAADLNGLFVYVLANITFSFVFTRDGTQAMAANYMVSLSCKTYEKILLLALEADDTDLLSRLLLAGEELSVLRYILLNAKYLRSSSHSASTSRLDSFLERLPSNVQRELKDLINRDGNKTFDISKLDPHSNPNTELRAYFVLPELISWCSLETTSRASAAYQRVKELLRHHGLDYNALNLVSQSDTVSNPALKGAADLGYSQVLKFFVDYLHIDMEKTSVSGNIALGSVVAAKTTVYHLARARFLLREYADIHKKYKDDLTATHVAEVAGNFRALYKIQDSIRRRAAIR